MLARGNDNPGSRMRESTRGLRIILAILFCLLLLAGFNRQFPQTAAQIGKQISVANAEVWSNMLVETLDKLGLPRQFLILEGMPYVSRVNDELVHSTRARLLTLSFYMLTQVDITDPRTFFLVQLPLPGSDLFNQAAYNPADPEQEGPIIEVVEEPKPEPSPGPPGPAQVAIYTSHNSESYAGDGGPDHDSGSNGEITQVAAALGTDLDRDGTPFVLSDKIHDFPKPLLAYSESVKTATQLMRANPKLQVVLDVHRDGLPDGKSKRIVQVQGKPASPVLIVLGTKNPNWQKNEEFAKELIAKGNAKYPGLFLPIYYATDARYNQHLHPHALLLEFGDQYNTTQEAKNAASAVAEVLADMLKTKN